MWHLETATPNSNWEWKCLTALVPGTKVLLTDRPPSCCPTALSPVHPAHEQSRAPGTQGTEPSSYRADTQGESQPEVDADKEKTLRKCCSGGGDRHQNQQLSQGLSAWARDSPRGDSPVHSAHEQSRDPGTQGTDSQVM